MQAAAVSILSMPLRVTIRSVAIKEMTFRLAGRGATNSLVEAAATYLFFLSMTARFSATLCDEIKDFKYAEADQIQLVGLSQVVCRISSTKASSFEAVVVAANTGFSSGSNVWIQRLGKNALMLVDMDGNGQPDLALSLIGVKVSDAHFPNYAESGAMFA